MQWTDTCWRNLLILLTLHDAISQGSILNQLKRSMNIIRNWLFVLCLVPMELWETVGEAATVSWPFSQASSSTHWPGRQLQDVGLQWRWDGALGCVEVLQQNQHRLARKVAQQHPLCGGHSIFPHTNTTLVHLVGNKGKEEEIRKGWWCRKKRKSNTGTCNSQNIALVLL